MSLSIFISSGSPALQSMIVADLQQMSGKIGVRAAFGNSRQFAPMMTMKPSSLWSFHHESYGFSLILMT